MDAYNAFMERTADGFESIEHTGFLERLTPDEFANNVPAEVFVSVLINKCTREYDLMSPSISRLKSPINDWYNRGYLDYNQLIRRIGTNYFNPLDIMPRYEKAMKNYAVFSPFMDPPRHVDFNLASSETSMGNHDYLTVIMCDALHWKPQQMLKYDIHVNDTLSEFLNAGNEDLSVLDDIQDPPRWKVNYKLVAKNKQRGDFDVAKFIRAPMAVPNPIIDEYELPEITDNLGELFANSSMTWPIAAKLLSIARNKWAIDDDQYFALYRTLMANPMDYHRDRYLLAAVS